jgi:hypothetical protein
VISSNVLVANTGGTCGADDGTGDGNGLGVGYYNCNFATPISAASGNSATLTFRTNPSGDGLTYLTAVATITIGGSVATETLSLDKTSYTAGEPVVATFTGKDSAGNPVYDGAATVAATASKTLGGDLPGVSQYVGGVKATSANKLFAPVTTGVFSLFATSGNTAATKLTVSATVAADTTATDISQAAADAAAESTDAANAATDAANAAAEAADAATAAAQDAADAVAALSTQVAELIGDLRKQITSLTNLVIKIQKKVKA